MERWLTSNLRKDIMKNKYFILFLVLGCMSFSLFSIDGNDLYLNKSKEKVEIFGPDFISTGMDERDITISPDKNLILFSKTFNRKINAIMVVEKKKKGWSSPSVASFSGKYKDIEPAFSPDGKKLFFASNRPMKNEDKPGDFNIWYVDKKNNKWNDPVCLDETINTEKNEFYPSISKSGNLYYTCGYKDSLGKEDIYLSRLKNGKYQKRENLGKNINSRYFEFNAFIDPDERYIIFTSFGRKDGMGKGDLYISFKDESNNWTKAINMGPEINTSESLEYCPFVSFDKKSFFFTSNRFLYKKLYTKKLNYEEIKGIINSPGNGNKDIYWVDAKIIKNLQKKSIVTSPKK